GSGLPGGAGGTVTVDNRAAISTDGGIAIAAQSIGGFGGDAGVNTKGYGGAGGYGGNGGAVSVTNTGALRVGSATGTTPSSGFGLAAQSVGGGGGNAGGTAALIALGASGGTAGNGAAVTVANSGSISVYGDSSV